MPRDDRVAVYLRISEDKTGEELGVSRQREDCEALCDRRGWDVPPGQYYVDNDVSATRGRRPRWEEMMAAVERGEVAVVVGWTIDRTLRSGRDRLRMLEAGKAHGIIISIVRGSDMDLSTPAGRLTADILGAVALAEVETKADRQHRAAEQRAVQGKPWCSRRPFGYEAGGMVLRPGESALVREAYRAVLAGASVRGIATTWNAKGVLTSTGGRWHGATVSQMLRNPRYAGIRTRGRDAARAEVGPAVWPALVDEATFRTAVALLSDPARRAGASRERKYLLTGIALCGCCGKPMGSGRATSTGARVYVCKAHHHLSRAGQPCDDLVQAHVVARLARPDARELLVSRAPETVGLHDEAVLLRARLDTLATEFADGELTASQLRTATERIQTKLRAVEGRVVASARALVLTDLVGVEDVAARWGRLTLDRQRAVVSVLMTVTILPAGRGRGFDPAQVRIRPRKV
jgi:site-specific DNA recombinase